MDDTNDFIRNSLIALTGTVPYVGGSISFLLDKYIPSEAERKRNEFISKVSDDLEELREKVDAFNFETPEFYSIFTKLLRHAVEEYRDEKINAFTTGYLTQTGMTEQGAYKLVIPNKEVREVYKFQIQEWFKKSVFSNTEQLTAFWNGVEEGNTEAIEKYLNRILSNSISVFDTKAPDKESSYHTLLVGLLVGNANWLVKSNVEAGEGFADIIVEIEDPDAGIVMELKYVKVASELEKACEKALAQIKDRRYEEYLKNDGRNNILFYGLAFCKKRCKVIVESRGMYSTVL